MKSVQDLEAFNAIIARDTKAVFFLHSEWSGTSFMSLRKLEALQEQHSEVRYHLVLNDAPRNFLMLWLKEQEGKFWNGQSEIIPYRNGSWCHGNGELIGIKNGELEWFEPFTLQVSDEDLLAKFRS